MTTQSEDDERRIVDLEIKLTMLEQAYEQMSQEMIEQQTTIEKLARELEDAGTDLLLLECVPAALATEITAALEIPVIGIGAGPGVDGQILVLQDVLNITPGKKPRFSKNFMRGQNSIQSAISRYVSEVKRGKFPQKMHSF